MRYKILFTFTILILGATAAASSLSVDIGQTKAIFNRFAIPNTKNDRVSLPVENKLSSYRITGYLNLKNGNQFYFLYAPLETEYRFTSERAFIFADKNYSSGVNTKVDYKFNSYRLGYLWKWNMTNLKIWSGLVAKIRDAKIKVTQETTSSSFNNVGLVPLASFGFDLLLFGPISLYSHTDALGASQGSAYDSQIELRLSLDSMAFSVGKRVLGGGVDNDSVYNFAQFDSFYGRVTYLF